MTEEPQTTKPSFLDEIRAEKESLEKVRDENKQIVEQMERLKAESILGGTADAGQTKKQLTEEEKKKEGAKEFWAGSGIDKAIAKYG